MTKAIKHIQASLLLLLLYMTCIQVHAQNVIDYIDSTHDKAVETVEIFFNVPVQYLYHTPRDNSSHSLIGLSIATFNNQGESRHNHVSVSQSLYLSDLEYLHESGFNPHLYVEFKEDVDLTVQLGKSMRSIILIIKKH